MNSENVLPAFLLTSQWFDTDGETQLVFWWSTPQGPVRTLVKHPCVCFIPAENQAGAEKVIAALGWPVTLRPVNLRFFDGRDALACYLPSEYLYRWRDALNGQGIMVRELDIRPADRYLMERFVAGGAQLTLTDERPHEHWLDAGLSAIKPARCEPQLRALSVDIETSFPRTGQPDRLFSIGCYAPDLSRVLMIGDQQNDDLVEYLPDETALLLRFLELIRDYDPDVLIGWNFIQFDMAFLRRKYEEHEIPFVLGRDGSELVWRESANRPGRVYLYAAGRVVLDGIECLRTATYNFESFALDDVGEQLLGEGKLLHGDDRGDDIERLFVEDKPALARYNLKDCELVWRIFEKTKLFEFLTERSHMTGLLMDRMGGSVAAFEYMYLPRLHRAGWVAPDIGDGYSAEKSPGGYVMDSRPGLFEHVLVLDFRSLYPSIIRTFRIDPLGLIQGVNKQQQGITDKNAIIPGFFGGSFDQQQHILPDLIRYYGDLRQQAKAQGNQPLSQAIKIIMASCYGVLGSEGCRFYDTRLSASITKRGHQIIQDTSRWISQQGYDVIYGDTDSVFVWLKKQVSDAEADVIGNQLAQGINRYWTERLQDEFAIESFLELEYETHYRRFFMPSIRGSEEGSKKRCAGLSAQTDQMVFRGLEAVRTDWTPLARNFQRELYRRVFFNEPYRDWVRAEVDALLKGQRDAQLLYRKRLRRPLAMYQKNRPPHARAAERMDQWLMQQGTPPRFAERGGWISYFITVNGPEPEEIRSSAMDYGHYLEKQIAPVAEAIFQFTGEDFEEMAGMQRGLF